MTYTIPTPDTLDMNGMGGWTGTYTVSYSDEQGNAHTSHDVTRAGVLDTLARVFGEATNVSTHTDRVSGMTEYGRATVVVVPTGWCWDCDGLACECNAAAPVIRCTAPQTGPGLATGITLAAMALKVSRSELAQATLAVLAYGIPQTVGDVTVAWNGELDRVTYAVPGE